MRHATAGSVRKVVPERDVQRVTARGATVDCVVPEDDSSLSLLQSLCHGRGHALNPPGLQSHRSRNHRDAWHLELRINS
eukprot:UN5100